MGDKEPNFSNYEESVNCFDMPMPSCSMDDLLKDYDACMHTHTCNPPVADLPHTHTCFHVHSKVLSNDKVGVGSDDAERKSNKGNKEATRKYREKIKTETALLKMKVEMVEAENWQLRKRLEGQAALEAENVRLKCLLADMRGRIEGEIGSFPYKNTILPAPCNMQGNDQACCLGQGGEGETPLNGCDFQPMQCFAYQHSGFKASTSTTDPSAPTKDVTVSK